MKRSQFVAVTGAALAAQARPARAAGAAIRLGSSPVEEWAIPYYATQKGFFRDAGLNVEVSNFPGGGFVTQAVLGGALDVGLTNSGSMAAAHVRGLPLYLLASGPIYTVKAPIAHLIVGKNSPINDATALAGKTIGVTTLNDMVQAAAMSWIDHRGIDSHSAKWFELRSSEMAPALEVGRIDAAVIVEPTYTSIKDRVKAIGLPYEAVNNGKPFQTGGAIGNKLWVDQNGDLARRLTAVLLHTADWAGKNPDEVSAMLAQMTKMDVAIVSSIPRVTYATKNDLGLVQPVIDVIARYGFIPKPFPAAELRAPGA
jgi:NitT/TauT family transport system substrate-binding protein